MKIRKIRKLIVNMREINNYRKFREYANVIKVDNFDCDFGTKIIIIIKEPLI